MTVNFREILAIFYCISLPHDVWCNETWVDERSRYTTDSSESNWKPTAIRSYSGIPTTEKWRTPFQWMIAQLRWNWYLETCVSPEKNLLITNRHHERCVCVSFGEQASNNTRRGMSRNEERWKKEAMAWFCIITGFREEWEAEGMRWVPEARIKRRKQRDGKKAQNTSYTVRAKTVSMKMRRRRMRDIVESGDEKRNKRTFGVLYLHASIDGPLGESEPDSNYVYRSSTWIRGREIQSLSQGFGSTNCEHSLVWSAWWIHRKRGTRRWTEWDGGEAKRKSEEAKKQCLWKTEHESLFLDTDSTRGWRTAFHRQEPMRHELSSPLFLPPD